MNLLDTLKKYGDDSLGYPSESTLKRLSSMCDELEENLSKLLNEPFKSIKAPLYHTKQDDGLYLCNPEEYVPYLQAMIGNRYSKSYSITEAVVKLEALGYNVSSKGQVSNIWNRQETKLGLKDKRRTAIKDSKARVAEDTSSSGRRGAPPPPTPGC